MRIEDVVFSPSKGVNGYIINGTRVPLKEAIDFIMKLTPFIWQSTRHYPSGRSWTTRHLSTDFDKIRISSMLRFACSKVSKNGSDTYESVSS